jgi:hypothetical protein
MTALAAGTVLLLAHFVFMHWSMLLSYASRFRLHLDPCISSVLCLLTPSQELNDAGV